VTNTRLHVLILSSYLFFFAGMVGSARPYYAGKPVNIRDALISGLLSPTDNPHGYLIASAGTAICGLLLLPVALAFYRRLLARNRRIAFAGSLLFALGPMCAVSIALFSHEITDTHVYLAFAAYIFMTSGLLVCLALEASAFMRARRGASISLVIAPGFLCIVLLFLFYLLFTPDFFNDSNLLRNVAFCEWTLCSVLAGYITGLAVLLSRPTR
jgi:hypothetical protein